MSGPAKASAIVHAISGGLDVIHPGAGAALRVGFEVTRLCIAIGTACRNISDSCERSEELKKLLGHQIPKLMAAHRLVTELERKQKCKINIEVQKAATEFQIAVQRLDLKISKFCKMNPFTRSIKLTTYLNDPIDRAVKHLETLETVMRIDGYMIQQQDHESIRQIKNKVNSAASIEAAIIGLKEKKKLLNDPAMWKVIKNDPLQMKEVYGAMKKIEKNLNSLSIEEQELFHVFASQVNRISIGCKELLELNLPSWHLTEDQFEYVEDDPGIQGGQGIIFRGTMNNGLSEVCIKRMLNQFSNDEMKQFHTTVELWYNLRNEHITQLHGASFYAQPPYVITELCEYGDLLLYLQDDEEPYLRQKQKLRLLMEAAKGIHYLHSKQIVHGDLKASNILVDKNERAKICDFDMSFETGKENKQIHQTEAFYWMAPELFSSKQSATLQSDVYSFGMTIYEVMTGQTPYQSSKTLDNMKSEKRKNSLPLRLESLKNKEVWDLIVQACKADPTERPTIEHILNQLESIWKKAEAKTQISTPKKQKGSSSKYLTTSSSPSLQTKGTAELQHAKTTKILTIVKPNKPYSRQKKIFGGITITFLILAGVTCGVIFAWNPKFIFSEISQKSGTNPVDCVLSEWGPWDDSGCASDNADSYMTRNRTVMTEAQDGGKICDALTQEAICGLQSEGTCSDGVYGANCDIPCSRPPHCASLSSVLCTKNTGTVKSCSSCGISFYGPTCDKSCTKPPDCTANSMVVCEKSTGMVLACSSCELGYFGNTCEIECARPSHCTSKSTLICDKSSGALSSCSICMSGFFGSTCENVCTTPNSCVPGTLVECDKNLGTISQCGSCKDGYYGTVCDERCTYPMNCNPDGIVKCHKSLGSQLSCSSCIDGYYGILCDSLCVRPPYCTTQSVLQCVQDTGEPTVCSACEDGFYGETCENSCAIPPQCTFDSIVVCDKLTGETLSCSKCLDGFYGTTCENTCSTPTDCLPGTSLICDKDTGRSISCTQCIDGFFGDNCENSCSTPTSCLPGSLVTCEKASGSTINCAACIDGFYGLICSSECTRPTNCMAQSTVVCDKVTGAMNSCSSCKNGFFGSTCDAECTRPSGCTSSGTLVCNKDVGAPLTCSACNDGLYGDICIFTCMKPVNCAPDSMVICEKNYNSAISCSTCIDGYYGNTCGNTCSRPSNCASSSTLRCDKNSGGALWCSKCKNAFYGDTCSSAIYRAGVSSSDCKVTYIHLGRFAKGNIELTFVNYDGSSDYNKEITSTGGGWQYEETSEGISDDIKQIWLRGTAPLCLHSATFNCGWDTTRTTGTWLQINARTVWLAIKDKGFGGDNLDWGSAYPDTSCFHLGRDGLKYVYIKSDAAFNCGGIGEVYDACVAQYLGQSW